MSRHTFRLSTFQRVVRAAKNAGVAVDRIEVNATGSVILHTAKPVEVASPDQRTAPQVEPAR